VKSRPSWVSLFLYCVLAAIGTALVFAIIVAGGAVALEAHQDATSEGSQNALPATAGGQGGTRFTGMITDSRCGARHMRNSHLSTAECAHACVLKGANYVLVDGDHRYILIGGEASVAKLAGVRANIVGTLQGDAILVNSAAALF
jgi:uncharacterized NAD-dependent epimerase/dehydratase family protein